MKMPKAALLLAALTAAPAALAAPAAAEPTEEVRALYERFAAAQNARDLDRVRGLLDAERFLWVSDGQSFWGRETMLARMASFQEAELWRVEPRLDAAVPVEVAPDAAYLHLPLTLVIGTRENPDRLAFLVSLLARRTPEGWRIAALFTTTAKRE